MTSGKLLAKGGGELPYKESHTLLSQGFWKGAVKGLRDIYDEVRILGKVIPRRLTQSCRQEA
jgi:hypothetical protein